VTTDPVAESGDALWYSLKSAQPKLVKRWRGYVVIERSATHSDASHGENAKISVCGLQDGSNYCLHPGYEITVRLSPIDANGAELGPSRFSEAAAVHARCTLSQDGVFRSGKLRTMDSVLREVEDARVLAAVLVSWVMVGDEELGDMPPMVDD